jgi:hypothetical protein
VLEGFMACRIINEISNEWVKEKLNCINPNEINLERRIERILRSKFEDGPKHFTPDEFSLFLRWKGLARKIEAFVQNNSPENVAMITGSLFSSRLAEWNFHNTQNNSIRDNILKEIKIVFYNLQNLRFVGPAVASACIALCFPDLCGTADYIVPAILHNMHDTNHNINPLYTNLGTAQMLQQVLMMPVEHGLTAYQARNIATGNYLTYIQELWNIKRTFELSDQVRKIEAAIWSFGICYVRKGTHNNRTTDNRPLIFNLNPRPPRRGPFSKPLFNPNNYCLN